MSTRSLSVTSRAPGFKSRHVPFRLTSLDDRGDMRAPGVERCAFLIGPVVALVDADNAGAAARDVIESGFSHFEADAEPL